MELPRMASERTELATASAACLADESCCASDRACSADCLAVRLSADTVCSNDSIKGLLTTSVASGRLGVDEAFRLVLNTRGVDLTATDVVVVVAIVKEDDAAALEGPKTGLVAVEVVNTAFDDGTTTEDAVLTATRAVLTALGGGGGGSRPVPHVGDNFKSNFPSAPIRYEFEPP